MEPMPGREPMPPWYYPMAGRLEEPIIDSQALTGNPLGDPHRRPLIVQLPPAYDAEPERRFPTIYVLQGLTNQVDMWRNRNSFRRNPLEELDARFASGEVPPVIVVYVDAWTSLGGSQFVDSPGTGRYATYLCDELVPFVDAGYRTMAAAAHRGLAGHSSGGYGAMVNAMRRPDLFGGIASHAGDGLFELCFIPAFGAVVKAMRDRYDGSFERFWDDFRSRPGRTHPADGELINVYCMAACFSADPDGTVQLPFDSRTGVLRPEVWQRWLDWDPVRMIPKYADALRGLRAIWIDAGVRDEWFLDIGAEAVHAALRAAAVPAERIRFELFEASHMAIDYRYPMSLAWLCHQITP